MNGSDVVDRVLQRLEANADGGLERVKAFLRIPSVSTDPAYAGRCQEAAEWVRAQLAGIGFEAAVHPTAGHPVVLAHRPGPPGAPHVLYYGHYDVQPPDPLELWDSDPFDPQLVDGPHGSRLVARGATDDKGQVMTWLEALRAWSEAAGGPPVGVTVLVEGEEEIGSAHLEPFLLANREALQADVAIISDTPLWTMDTPSLVTRLRGGVFMELVLTGPDRDLHSGLYGGSALNPLNALAAMLGGLHDADGRVAIPGFYDGVEPVPAAEAQQWEALGFDEGEFLRDVGLDGPAGEAGHGALERLWARPTVDVNGLSGGYQGDGVKAVIPSKAGAKLSFRLVPGQDPDAIANVAERWLRSRTPAGATLEVRRHHGFPAYAFEADEGWLRKAAGAVRREFQNPLSTVGIGGGIPVVESFKRVLGLDALLLGFGLSDDRLHSPNEKFEVACFRKGARSHARLLAELAGN